MKHLLVLLLLMTAAFARATPEVFLRNPALQCRLTCGDGDLAVFEITDTDSNHRLVLASGITPTLVLPGGKTFAIGPVLSSFRKDAGGNSRSATIGGNPHGLEGQCAIALHEDPAYAVASLTLKATRDLAIEEIVFLDTALEGAEILGKVDGSVLRSGPFFLAVEHPLAKLAKTPEGHFQCKLPRGNTLRAGESWTYSFVIGITPPGQFRRGFLRYLESRRAHPYRPYVHYNSWYHLNIARPGSHMTEKECMETVRHIGRELTDKRGVPLDAFVWDDGWDDHNSLWGFHDDFPQGFRKLREAAKKHGAGMGVWMSPWGGYGATKQRRIGFGKAYGYEINAGGFAMAGRNYGAAFRDRCFEMMDGHGVAFFKFDGMGGGNIVQGASGEAAADIDAVLELTRALRRKNPEVFISATIGTWPSPFWLLFVDSIWRQGEDTGFAGVGNGREKWITYRDAHTRLHIVQQAPCYPISNLMNGGLVIGERANPAQMPLDEASVRHEARTMIGSGTCLQELYIAPHLLTGPMWDAIAASVKWLRSRRDAFADVHWIGGDPAALEVYGWAGWHGGSGVLTLRNPSEQEANFKLDVVGSLDLPGDGLRTAYRLVSPYPDQRLRGLDCQAAEWCEITLQPFEVLSFDVMAANGAGTFEFGTYQEWSDQQAAEARDTAQDFLGSWTYAYQGHQFTRSFLPDGSATLAIDGEIWSGWPGRRWHIDDGNLVVTAPGAEPETHRINHRNHLVLPAGLGFAVRQRRE